jgi:hypothetical protein
LTAPQWSHLTWCEALWSDPDPTIIDWPQGLSTFYSTSGSGLVSSRTGWSNAAGLLLVNAGPGRQSHADRAAGQFAWWVAGAWAVGPARLWTQNTLLRETEYHPVLQAPPWNQPEFDERLREFQDAGKITSATDTPETTLIDLRLESAYRYWQWVDDNDMAKNRRPALVSYRRRIAFLKAARTLIVYDLAEPIKADQPFVWRYPLAQVPSPVMGQNRVFTFPHGGGVIRVTVLAPVMPVVAVGPLGLGNAQGLAPGALTIQVDRAPIGPGNRCTVVFEFLTADEAQRLSVPMWGLEGNDFVITTAKGKAQFQDGWTPPPPTKRRVYHLNQSTGTGDETYDNWTEFSSRLKGSMEGPTGDFKKIVFTTMEPVPAETPETPDLPAYRFDDPSLQKEAEQQDPEPGVIEIRMPYCPGCRAAIGDPHEEEFNEACPFEVCTVCGGRWAVCGHEDHSPSEAKWQGKLEAAQ